jgi:hypothetical protein
MVRKRVMAAVVAMAAVWAGVASAFPRANQFSLTPGFGVALASNSDIKDFYGPGLEMKTMPSIYAVGAGLDYNLTGSFQLGARYDRLIKGYSINILSGGTGVGKDVWNINANALLGHARLLFKGRDEKSWFAVSILAGRYSLAGAYGEYKPASSAAVGRVDLAGSTVGAEIGMEMEKPLNESLTWVLSAGWRAAKITGVTGSTKAGSGTLKNADGTDAALDLGGLNIGLGLRFYLGGN